MAGTKRVLLVNGSPHARGNTKHALQVVESALQGPRIETVWFELGTQPVRGCIACGRCAATSRCVFKDDKANELIEAMLASDAVVLGSPVYFAGPNGAFCALLDRAFYAAAEHGQLFAGKLGAAVVTVWREGGTAALDRLNKYFTFAQMPIVSSDYWNVQLGPGDRFGEEVLKTLGRNMRKMLVVA